MGIDTSVYQTQQPVQGVNVMDNLQKAYALSNIGMQNQQQQMALQGQQAMRQAYANNTDANGNVNWNGVIGDVGRVNPMMAMQLGQQRTAMQKSQADAQNAQMNAAHSTLSLTMPAMDYLIHNVPADQRPQVWQTQRQQLIQQGVDPSKLPAEYDPDTFNLAYAQGSRMKEALDNQLTQANINETNQKANMIGTGKGADELANYKTDVLTPSSRTPQGALYQAQNRAQRLISTANQGLPANASEQDKVAYYNKLIPQMVDLTTQEAAALAQGGSPDENTAKATGISSAESALARAKQSITGNPTSAQLGALVNAYVDYAKAIGGYSNQMLQKYAVDTRKAYPFGEKYYGDRMDAIQKSVKDMWNNGNAPDGGNTQPGGSGQILGSSGSLIPSANAADFRPAAKSTQAQAKAVPSGQDQQALSWLKTADPSSPDAFAVRAKLKKKGLL